MNFACTICNKKYLSYNSLWRHNKIKHNSIVSQISHAVSQISPIVSQINPSVSQINPSILDNNYKCKHCNKIYSNRNSKYKHQIKCKNSIITLLNNKVNELENKITNNKINESENNIIDKNIITNKNNKINNGIVNHITINKMGSEKLEDLTNKDINNIFSKEIESIFTFIELLNFNIGIPENHNHCVTNLESKYLSIYNSNTKKIEKDRKKYFFDALLCKSIDRMNILFNNNKNKFTSKKQNKISNTIDTLNKLKDSYYNPKLFNELIHKLNLLAYNNKNIIIDTWNNNTKNMLNDDLDEIDVNELLEERKKRLHMPLLIDTSDTDT
jgi:hypothetical protein